MNAENMRKFYLVFLFLFILFVRDATAEPINIDSDLKLFPIGPVSEVLLDPSGELSINEASSTEYNTRFRHHGSSSFNFGMTESVIWVRFLISKSNDQKRLQDLVLTVDKSNFPYVDLYLPRADNAGESYQRIRCSYLARTDDRTLRYRYPVFKLPRDIPGNKYIFLRIDPYISNKHASSNFTIILTNKDNFMQFSWLDLTFFNLVFGVLIAMIIYNLFLAVFLKSPAHYLYVFYVFFIFLYLFLRSGFNILAGFPALSYGVLYAVALAYMFGLAFSRRFLDTRDYCPILDKIIWAVFGFSFLVIAALFAEQPKFANTLMHLLGIIGPLTAIVAGVVRLYQGYTPARYYLAAWFTLFLSTITVAMIGLGFIPKNFMTINSLPIGSALETILLSTALAERIRVLRLEKQELQKKERRLMELSIKDELTGLFNKRWFSSKLLSEIEHNRRLRQPLSLMILDVDHFKQFNDNYGHAAGDKVLEELGRVISTNIRGADIGCRYGGEEFAVIMPGLGIEDALNVAERIRQTFEETSFSINSKINVQATISIGVAELDESDSEEHLFEKTDQALYRAKEAGRNIVIRY